MRKLALCALVLVSVVAALPATAGARARAASVKVAVPAPGAVSVALGTVKGKVGRVTVGKAPRGVIVTGGAKKGTLALAVALPRRAGARAAAVGSVVIRVAGRGAKPKVGKLQVTRNALAQPPGRPAACGSGPTLAALLGHALGGAANGLGPALAARLCGGALDGAATAALKRLGLDVPAAPKPTA